MAGDVSAGAGAAGRAYDARRALLLLVARPEATRPQIAAGLMGAVAPLRQRARDAGTRIRFATQLSDDPLAALARATSRDVHPVAAAIEVTGDCDAADDAFLRVVSGSGNWLGSVFDRTRSTAELGSVRKITEGPPGPAMLVLASRRRDGMSLAEFHRYWTEVHAPLALRLWPAGAVERVGYQQFHVDESASARAAESAGLTASGYSGVLQVLCRTAEDFLGINVDPAYAAAIYEDEQKFTKPGGMLGACLELTD